MIIGDQQTMAKSFAEYCSWLYTANNKLEDAYKTLHTQ